MHRYVWSFYNGPIPATRKLHVHHIDHDRSNNDVSNLELISVSEHVRKHPGRDVYECNRVAGNTTWRRRKATSEVCELCGITFQARAMARENRRFCSSSCRGRYNVTIGKTPDGRSHERRVCVVCGTQFDTPRKQGNDRRTCTRRCTAQVAARTRVDRHGQRRVVEDRVCPICKVEFHVDSYRPAIACGGSCRKRLADRRRDAGV